MDAKHQTTGPGTVVFSPHALEQLNRRHARINNGQTLRDPHVTASKLISKSTPDAVDAKHRVYRLISNGFHEAEYWVSNGWRFVISMRNGVRTVVTIERTNYWDN